MIIPIKLCDVRLAERYESYGPTVGSYTEQVGHTSAVCEPHVNIEAPSTRSEVGRTVTVVARTRNT